MQHPPQGDPRSDTDLISSVRLGDPSAFAELYSRHAAAVRTVAGYYTSDAATADDLTSDAFERMLRMLQSGRGPDVSFRAYIYTIVRRLALEHAEGARQVTVTDDFTPYEARDAVIDPTSGGFETRMVASAFSSLPERWQAALWYLEVERMRPAEIGVILGLSANGVSALAYRAREALRSAYLQAHVSPEAARRGCSTVRGSLGAWVAGSLSDRDARRVREHVASCDECPAIVDELKDVGHGLRAFVAPLLIGGAAAGGLAAVSASGGSASAAAVASGSTATALAAVTGVAAAVAGAVALSAIAVLPISSPPILAPEWHRDPSVAPTPIPTPSVTPAPPIQPMPTPTTPSPTPESPVVPPVPPAPVPQLALAVDDLGELVLGGSGMVGATLSASEVAGHATLSVDLPPGVMLDSSRSVALADPGWVCAPEGTDALCTIDTLTADRTYTIAVPVVVAGDADTSTPVAMTLSADRAAAVSAVGAGTVATSGVSTRFIAAGGYTVVTAGSSFLDCDPASPGCAEAREFAGDPAGFDNHKWALVARREAEVVAASATVAIPAGSRVAFAGLYWSGVVPSGATDGELGTITLRDPSGHGTVVGASRTDRAAMSSAERYQSFADVTALVHQGGGGLWTALDPVIETPATGAHAGWSLVVVYEDDAAAPQRVTIADGFVPVVDAPVILALPMGGADTTTLGVVAWEGDAGIGGDRLLVDGVAAQRLGADGPDNAFRSRADGADVINTFGVDVGWFVPSPVAGRRAVVTVETTGDQLAVGVLIALTPIR